MGKNKSHPHYPASLGAFLLDNGECLFRVWAPKQQDLQLNIVKPRPRLLPMKRRDRGYFEAVAVDTEPGTEYFYRLDNGQNRPDPASRFQPYGVHLPSAVVDRQFAWQDLYWRGIPLHQYITYELHVGTFTPEGTFEAIIPHLDDLCDLGITAIELLPCAQFPGARNWGYDGVHPFAPQNSYGGPLGLKRLVNACHLQGIAVVMDAVYNHLGPEGNYFDEFGHYFSDRYQTPWGRAINFDRRHSDEVRRFFIENALFWIDECHIDALRLDAVHAIFDNSARPFLRELATAVRQEGERLNRRVYTIAESNLNDPRLMLPSEVNGCGLDGQWCDDFHHALRTTLTSEANGYYADFHGFEDLVKAFRDGFVQDGDNSQYRGRRHGQSSRSISPTRLVVCSQNHDQVGNRLLGERLSELISFEQLKLAAAAVILSPYQPLLFMGEEYGEIARFQFFISHLDPALCAAVNRGRQQEFASFQWDVPPPLPDDDVTFQRSKLNHQLKDQPQNRALRDFYRTLLHIRRDDPVFVFPERDQYDVLEIIADKAMAVLYRADKHELTVILHFGDEATTSNVPCLVGTWEKILDSADPRWLGLGSELPQQINSHGTSELTLPPYSAAVYRRLN
jgi:maltooligosyltrehalose trehalohydrolase